MNSSYGIFARFYDELTENAEYKKRSEYISSFFEAEDGKKYKVLDVACGTGTIAACLSSSGFDVTGIDISEDMLSVASSKGDFRLLKSDMRSFDFNGEFDACVCTLDSLNHLNSPGEWKSCFKSVYSSLKDGGLFIFDVNTVYKHNEILAGNAFVFDEEDFFLSWDNEPLENNKVRILLDFFVYNGRNYDRYSEEFFETAYPEDEIKDMLKGDFDILGIYNDLTRNSPTDKSERIFFVCRKHK